MAENDPWESSSDAAQVDPWDAAKPADGQTASSYATGAAKAAGTGLAKGTIGLATLPGNVGSMVDAAGQWLVDKVNPDLAKTLKGLSEPSENASTFYPTSSQVEKAVGLKDHEPQNAAEKYIGTAAEFAPSAVLGGGSAASRILSTLGAAGGDNVADFLSDGNPIAKLIGAVIGGVAPSRMVTPLAAEKEQKAFVDYLTKEEGVKSLSAGQKTGNKPLKYAEASLGDADKVNNSVAKEYTNAVMKRAGEDGQLATPEVLTSAYERIGGKINDLANRNVWVRDPQFDAEISNAYKEYNRLVPESQRVPAVDKYIEDMQRLGNAAKGDVYNTLRSSISADARAVPSMSDSATGAYKKFLINTNKALDGAMERSIQTLNPGDVGEFSKARRQYRNLMVIEDAASGAGEGAARGIITPSKLRQSLDKSEYAYGEGDFAKLARAGNAVMAPLPTSGTSERLATKGVAASLGGAAAAMATGAAGHGELAAPLISAIGLGSAAGPYVAGKAINSGIGQKYLSNQILGKSDMPSTLDSLLRAAAPEAANAR